MLCETLDASNGYISPRPVVPLPLPQIHDTAQPLLLGDGRASGNFVDVLPVVAVLLQLAHVSLSECVIDGLVLWYRAGALAREAIVPSGPVGHFVHHSWL